MSDEAHPIVDNTTPLHKGQKHDPAAVAQAMNPDQLAESSSSSRMKSSDDRAAGSGGVLDGTTGQSSSGGGVGAGTYTSQGGSASSIPGMSSGGSGDSGSSPYRGGSSGQDTSSGGTGDHTAESIAHGEAHAHDHGGDTEHVIDNTTPLRKNQIADPSFVSGVQHATDVDSSTGGQSSNAASSGPSGSSGSNFGSGSNTGNVGDKAREAARSAGDQVKNSDAAHAAGRAAEGGIGGAALGAGLGAPAGPAGSAAAAAIGTTVGVVAGAAEGKAEVEGKKQGSAAGGAPSSGPQTSQTPSQSGSGSAGSTTAGSSGATSRSQGGSASGHLSQARAIVSHDTHANGGWKMEDVGVRSPGKGELLVEMVASGVCHTDALIGDIPSGAAPIAFYPRVLGHEGSGYVRSVGEGVTVAKEGDPVLLSFAFCNDCAICKAGHYSNCNNFNELNFGGPFKNFALASKGGEPEIGGAFFGQSSFASLSIVRECSVVNAKSLVNSKEDLQLFAPLGCGIQTGSGTVVNAARAEQKDVIVILGLGGVGLSAVMGAKVQGCRSIIGVDRVASRLQMAKELGCTEVIDGSKIGDKMKLEDAIKEAAEGVGATIVVDTTGAPPLVNAGIASLRNKGRYYQVGTTPFDFKLEQNMFEFMVAGKSVNGAIEGEAYPPEYVPKMIGWYRDGKFPFDRLCKFMKADEFEQALKEMHDGVTIKPILTW